MKESFGPWSSAISAGRNLQLSTFWRHRMSCLPLVGKSEALLTRRGALRLATAGIAVT